MNKTLFTFLCIVHASISYSQQTELGSIEFTVSDTVKIEPDKYFFNLTVSEKSNSSLYDYNYTDDLYNDDTYYSKQKNNNKQTESFNISLAKAEKLIKDLRIKQLAADNNNYTILQNNNPNIKTFYLEFTSPKTLAEFIQKAKELQNVYGVLSGTEISEQKRKNAENRLVQKLYAETNRKVQDIAKAFGIITGKIIFLRFFDDITPETYFGYGNYEGDYYMNDLQYYTYLNKSSQDMITLKKSVTVKYELK